MRFPSLSLSPCAAQEDAHEFARYLIEAMQAACVGARKLPPGVAETSFVSRVFGGRLRSQIKCACGRDSNTYDPFLDLSLEVVRAASVDKALSRFCATEVLDGDNKCVPARLFMPDLTVPRTSSA
jgi:ubiquitin carboxyl-terminal hydrolase 36/42